MVDEKKKHAKPNVPQRILVRFALVRIGLFALSFLAMYLYYREQYPIVRISDWYTLFLAGLFLAVPIQTLISIGILTRHYRFSRLIILFFVIVFILVLLICLLLALYAMFMNADASAFAFGPGLCDPMPDGSAPMHDVPVYENIRFLPIKVLTGFEQECSCPSLCP